MKQKNKKENFLGMLLGTLGDCLLGNLLTDIGTIRAKFLMPPPPLTNFKMQKCYENELKFNGVYSRNNLPKIKDRANVTNLDKHKLIGNHWIPLYVNNNNVTFDSFGVKYIAKQIQKKRKYNKYLKKTSMQLDNM